MSAKIFCDRCGHEDTAKFYNAHIDVKPGSYASIVARGCGVSPWVKDWHLCGYCAYDLQKWTAQRNAAGKLAS